MQLARIFTDAYGHDEWHFHIKVADLAIPVGRSELGRALPLSPSIDADDLYEKIARDEGWLTECDVAEYDGETVACGEIRHSDYLLVLVEPTTVPGGMLVFEANSFDETITGSLRKRVEKRYHPFPSVGIEVLRQSRGPNDEMQAIIVMTPGASFRYVRGGKRGYLSPVITIAWTAQDLKVMVPGKYKKELEKTRKRLHAPEPSPTLLSAAELHESREEVAAQRSRPRACDQYHWYRDTDAHPGDIQVEGLPMPTVGAVAEA